MTRQEVMDEMDRLIIKNRLWFSALKIAVVLLLAFTVWRLSSEVKIVQKTLVENLSTIVAVTDSGTLIEVDKQEMYADLQQSIITRALRNLIVSRADITNGFEYSKFENNEQVVERSSQLKFFLQYILLDREERVKDVYVENMLTSSKISVIALKEQAIGYFDAYIESIKYKLQKDNLPHFISIRNHKIVSFMPKGKNFKIEINYTVIMQNHGGYNKDSTIKYNTEKGTYTIKATGYFDVRTRSVYTHGQRENGTNKIGLHFTSFKIKEPKK